MECIFIGNCYWSLQTRQSSPQGQSVRARDWLDNPQLNRRFFFPTPLLSSINGLKCVSPKTQRKGANGFGGSGSEAKWMDRRWNVDGQQNRRVVNRNGSALHQQPAVPTTTQPIAMNVSEWTVK